METGPEKSQKMELAGNNFKTANMDVFKNVEKYIINEQIRILRKLTESTIINQMQILELKILTSYI